MEKRLCSLLQKAVDKLGVSNEIDPLLTLSFMSLPVIPDLKITALGLFDTATFSFIPLKAD